MRLTKPRVLPLSQEEWAATDLARASSPAQRHKPLNITTTLARRPEVYADFQPWAQRVFGKSTLPRRQLEIAILRTGFRCRSGYEWEQHVVFALQAGLTKAEIERIKQGADAPGWSPSDAALIRAADALHDDQFIDDALWGELLAHFSPEQAQDAVFAIAQYTQVAMILNTLGVQLEPGMTLDPDLKAY
jgi:4-carboxymuconolactone decarboxylase